MKIMNKWKYGGREVSISNSIKKIKQLKSKLKKYVKPIRGKTFLQNESRLEQTEGRFIYAVYGYLSNWILQRFHFSQS